MTRDNRIYVGAGTASGNGTKRQFAQGGDPQCEHAVGPADERENTTHLDDYTLMMKQAMQGRA